MSSVRARVIVEEVDSRGNVLWSASATAGPSVLADFSTTAASAIAATARVVNHAIEAEYQRRTDRDRLE